MKKIVKILERHKRRSSLVFSSLCLCVLTTRLFFAVFTAKNLVGAENEYMAFLWLRALELQGEVQEAFVHAVIYKALDPQVFTILP